MTAEARGWGRGWPANNASKMVTVSRPDGVRVPVHREIAELVAWLLEWTERLGYDLRPGWCWGYSNRPIRGTRRPSNHSWGLAGDLNAPENPMGPRTGKIRKHPKVIDLWERFGFRWGGRYSGRADDMHMEFMGTPADAKAMTALARTQLAGGDFMAALNDKEQRELLDGVRALRKSLDEKERRGVVGLILRTRRIAVAVARKVGLTDAEIQEAEGQG